MTMHTHILAAILAVLILIDRRQTLAFLARGVPEGNPIARWVMEHYRTDAEGYLPGARIWFAGALIVLGVLMASALLLPQPWFYGPIALLVLWLPPQGWCVWHNWMRGY